MATTDNPAIMVLGTPRRKRKTDDGAEDEVEAIDLLRDIQIKLIEVGERMSKIEQKFETHISTCSGNDSNFSDIKNQLEEIKEVVRQNPTGPSTQQALENIVSETEAEDFEADKLLKFENVPEWGKLHKERRELYYKSMVQQEQAKIMEGWLEIENGHPRYLMRKHRPTPIKGQSDAIYKCREDHAVASMICEIEEKKIYSHEHKKKYEEIDNKIISLCDEITDPNIQNKLKTMWQREVKNAENKGKEYWVKKKKPWWINRPRIDPYLGKPTNANPPTTNVSENISNDTPNEEPLNSNEDMETDQNFTTTYRGRHRGAPVNNNTRRGQRGNFRGRSLSRGRNSYNGGNNTRGRSNSRGRGHFRGRSASRSRGRNNRGRGGYRGSHNNNSNNSNNVHFFQGRSDHIPPR